jgi:7-cyano-7-deazaguanine reductase
MAKSIPLGQQTEYVSQYDASLLFPIPRRESRAQLGILGSLPFYGFDIWTGYEVSWLNEKGKPQVAVAEFSVPCDSPAIIESKSFKLYLNSLNQTRFTNIDAVKACLEADLTAAAGASVSVSLRDLDGSSLLIDTTYTGDLIDHLDIVADTYHPQPEFLGNDNGDAHEILYSNLLKSNCPVTGQPDWASLIVEYRGRKINREGLLRYVISFREHQDFHEHCVERIFMDITARCKPEFLSVYARYTRRGGLDINPFRTSDPSAKPAVGRLLRQ